MGSHKNSQSVIVYAVRNSKTGDIRIQESDIQPILSPDEKPVAKYFCKDDGTPEIEITSLGALFGGFDVISAYILLKSLPSDTFNEILDYIKARHGTVSEDDTLTCLLKVYREFRKKPDAYKLGLVQKLMGDKYENLQKRIVLDIYAGISGKEVKFDYLKDLDIGAVPPVRT
jgi:hypothetical protein